MAGQNSQSGVFALGLQSVKGTPVPATRIARMRGTGLGGDRSLLIPDPEIGGNRDIPQAYLGSVSFGGDAEFYPRMQMIAQLLYGVLGAKASTDDAGPPLVGTHVLTPADTQPWWTIEERVGHDLEVFQYTDAKVNSLRLEAEATGFLTGSANIIALRAKSGHTLTSALPTDTTPMIMGAAIDFEFGGESLKGRSFNFEITNNFENDDFRLGSVFLEDLVGKRRQCTIGTSYRPEDSALWKQAMWGLESVDIPQVGPAFRGEVDITITTFETIGDEVGGEPFSLTINIPECVIAPHKWSPSGDDILGSDIEFTAIRPNPANPLLTATVVNDLDEID